LLRGQDYEAALELIEQGLATTSRNSERIFEAELYRLKARALLLRGAPDAKTEAQSLLDQALTTARSQHAKALELRASMDCAALWTDQGRHEEAVNFLAPIYASFTEGFDTQDLRQAKALLARLR
jgi:predicted ATPase